MFRVYPDSFPERPHTAPAIPHIPSPPRRARACSWAAKPALRPGGTTPWNMAFQTPRTVNNGLFRCENLTQTSSSPSADIYWRESDVNWSITLLETTFPPSTPATPSPPEDRPTTNQNRRPTNAVVEVRSIPLITISSFKSKEFLHYFSILFPLV